MKAAGSVCFVLGLVLSATYAARPASLNAELMAKLSSRGLLTLWAEVALVPYLVGLLLMIVGVVLARWRRPGLAVAATEGRGAGAPEELLTQIEAAVAKLDFTSPVEDTSQQISELLEGEMAAFVEHGPALTARLGLLAYSELNGEFARAERNLARAWSALIDGAHEEVPLAVGRAQTALERVRAQLVNAQSERSSGA